VGARSAIIVRAASPDALAAHVARTMCGQLAGATTCTKEEPEWLAPPFRWCLVWDAFKQLVRDQPDAPRHPRTAEWEQRYGHRLVGENAAAQLDLVQQWYHEDEQDTQARHDVFFGTYEPSAVQQVVGVATSSTQWPARLERALANFHRARWAGRYLRNPPIEPSTPTGGKRHGQD
jgi:hypothetical protein